jgi:integrase
LQRLPTVRQGAAGDWIFLSSRGKPLSRDGVAYILAKYVAMAGNDVPTLRRRRITPHVLRHYLPRLTMSCRAKSSAKGFEKPGSCFPASITLHDIVLRLQAVEKTQ